FAGYDTLTLSGAKILALIANGNISEEAVGGDDVSVIVDKTSLYAESGGQKGDRGIVKTATGVVEIVDSIKAGHNKIAMLGKVTEGSVKTGQPAETIADGERRLQTARNHSATHLMQKALRDVLGNHVEQAGSYVSYERLRFDFTHFSAMTPEEIARVEATVNDKIFEALDISSKETSIAEAKAAGAMALFGEKYGDTVRMVNMGGYSIELCGGTHLKNTAQIGLFKILSETGVAAGVRRIEAVTGKGAIAYYHQVEDQLNEVSALLKTTPDNLYKRAESYITKVRDLTKELDQFRSKMAGNLIGDLLNTKESVEGIDVIAQSVDNLDMGGLRELGDKLKDQLKSGVILLAGGKEGKYNLLAMATDDVVKQGINAGAIIKEAAAAAGGTGGGRPNMAQAGVKDNSKIAAALAKAKEIIKAQKK
ncbi:MAG: alanine--tRNA ligase, partial [Clostridiales bacterium]|nr:alanine--tRNA ligase [Clostridiales bacterium]